MSWLRNTWPRKVPPRYVVALKTDCLVFQDLPKKFLPAVSQPGSTRTARRCTALRSSAWRASTGSPASRRPYLTSYGPEWRSVEDPLLRCLNGKSLLLSGMPGTGRRTWRARSWRSSVSLWRWSSSSPRPTAPCKTLARSADGGPLRPQEQLDRLVIEEITQLDCPASGLTSWSCL